MVFSKKAQNYCILFSFAPPISSPAPDPKRIKAYCLRLWFAHGSCLTPNLHFAELQ
jgi:hypothetical protein